MEQGSNIIEKEAMEEMTTKEVARAIEWFKAKGLNEVDVCNFLTYVGTGVGLPNEEPAEKKSD